MSFNSHAYNISIRHGSFEGEDLFEARIKELPDVIEYAETAADAHALAINTIETTATHFKSIGKSMPAPSVPVDDYSGRLTLRTPTGLHRALAEAAISEKTSLNQYIVGILSFCTGFSLGQKSPYEGSWIASTEPTQPVIKKKAVQHLTLVKSFEPCHGYTVN